MTLKLFKVAEVCGIAELQPYVLRSWEKEFPGIGVQQVSDGQRRYRQSDIDQVLRIKQLVFGEGLTLAGARRRLEEAAPVASETLSAEETETEALGVDARKCIGDVRDGLRSLLRLLDGGSAQDAVPAVKRKRGPSRTPATFGIVPKGKRARV